MTSTTEASTPTPSQRKKVILGLLAIVLVLGVAGGFYVNYRVNRFVNNTFRQENPTPQPEQPAATVTTVPTSQPTNPVTGVATAATNGPQATSPVVASAPATLVAPTPTQPTYGNSPIIQRLKGGQRVSVLLLGFGGPGHDGGYLTDTLQVMSFEPKTGVVTLISIPRDLWVMVPATQGRGGYWGRINEAYQVGMGNIDRNDQNVPYSKHEAGGQNAMKAVSQVLGIPIDYWISLDFVGFRRFIDAIGGVDVNVERAFTDTQYPNNDDANEDPSYRTVHFDAGLQHMDGGQAIAFARSRYAPEDGSDFGRSRRQQLLMRAVKDKVVSVEIIPKMFGILDALEGHIRMSFSFTEAKDLLGWGQEQAAAKRPFAVNSGVIDSGNLLYGATSSGGASILLPRAGQGSYTDIQRWVRSLLDNGPETPVTGTPASGTPATGTPTR